MLVNISYLWFWVLDLEVGIWTDIKNNSKCSFMGPGAPKMDIDNLRPFIYHGSM